MKRIAKPLLKLAASVLLIALVIHAFDVRGIARQLLQVDAGTLILAVMIALALAPLHTARWMIVIDASRSRLDFGKALQIVLIGYFFNQTLPSSVGGDALRVWCAHRAGLSLAHAANTVVVDRLLTLVALLIVTAAGLPWLLDMIADPSARWGLTVIIAAGLAASYLFAALRRFPEFMGRWRIFRAFARLNSLTRTVLFTPRFSVPVLGLSAIGYGVFAFIVFILARAMHLEVTLAQCLLLVPPVILVTVLPISVAGWGVREGAMVVAFGFIHVPATAAFAISVLFGVVLALASLPGSLVWWLGRYQPGR